MVVDAALPFEAQFAHAMWLKTWFGLERSALVVPLLHRAHDASCVEAAERLAELTGLNLAAAGDVLMHVRARKPLQDALTATRLGRPVAECGFALEPNAEAHLRSRQRLAALYPAEWLAASVRIAASCAFSLDELRYEYPEEIVPEGHTPASWLRTLTEAGARKRFPDGVPLKVRQAIEHELALIARLRFEPYFLTVADVVSWAREQKILCQGRGSAANSTVCYCLGVTEVDPDRMTLLFERFVSAERNEPPDIDVDFEHQRREEVLQYIYRKYGRHRAALTAVVISYRPRSALRDMGRAMGIDLDRIAAVARGQHWFDGRAIHADRLRENGLDPDSPVCKLWVELTQALIGFPRHLSQHPGGFVIARDDVSRLVPVENAAMDDRTVIQWDKDDLDTLGLIKVDVLALGMLSAIKHALVFIAQKKGVPEFRMQDVPPEDKTVYQMLSRADSIGTFQVESRAQMSMLPRLKPDNFYDLVIEVAIVRPGPIQGGMVHPYLKRRNGEEPVDYPSAEVKQALERTLGVPIFQEQVMQLAILAADFTPGEADALRRAMAAWKRKGGLGPFHTRLVGRMVDKGYTLDYAERIFKQIEGFGEYGFPESHAASFALLVYVSAWIKRHHPDAFLAALLNSQPMGFYAPAQLTRDARAHGVQVLPVDVLKSEWTSVLEPSTEALCPVRLGFNRLLGFQQEAAERLVAARTQGPFDGIEDLTRRAALDARALQLLSQGDALRPLAGHRHQAAWGSAGVDTRATAMLREHAHARSASRARGAQCRRRVAGRLPQHRPVAHQPPVGAAARSAGEVSGAACHCAQRLSQWTTGTRQRPGHAPPASRNREGCDLRDAGGRDRSRQRDRLAAGGPEPAQAAAGVDAAHRVWRVAVRGRGAPPDRAQAGRSLVTAAGLERQEPQLPLRETARALAGPLHGNAKLGSVLLLRVVLLAIDVLALVVIGPLHTRLLVGSDMAVAAGVGFGLGHLGLAVLELGHLAVGQRAVLHAALDALLLVDVALHIGLHALGGVRLRIAGHAVVLGGIDVAADLVLRGIEFGLLGRRHLAVLQRLRLQLVDARFLALQRRGFARVERAALQPLLDALLLVDVALHRVRSRLRERGGAAAQQQVGQ